MYSETEPTAFYGSNDGGDSWDKMSSSIVDTLSSTYLLAPGSTLRIFFQFSCTSFISRNSLAVLTPLL